MAGIALCRGVVWCVTLRCVVFSRCVPLRTVHVLSLLLAFLEDTSLLDTNALLFNASYYFLLSWCLWHGAGLPRYRLANGRAGRLVPGRRLDTTSSLPSSLSSFSRGGPRISRYQPMAINLYLYLGYFTVPTVPNLKHLSSSSASSGLLQGARLGDSGLLVPSYEAIGLPPPLPPPSTDPDHWDLGPGLSVFRNRPLRGCWARVLVELPL
ncbi:hypothetical protein BDW74DRAFT_162288, partial [Aspergillus multicolor]|uniref:uncharacterized protein n=1 Tax=Aspergillus multicolor TaxID=41759 RepID=UPI003CCD7B5B